MPNDLAQAPQLDLSDPATIIRVLVVLVILILVGLYVISPIDLLPANPIDDIVVSAIGFIFSALIMGVRR